MNYYTEIRYKGREEAKNTMSQEEKTNLILDHKTGFDIEESTTGNKTKIYLLKDGKRVVRLDIREMSSISKTIRTQYVSEDLEQRVKDLKNAMTGSKAYFAMKNLYEKIDSTIQHNKEILEELRII
jgi:hypothetical protein